jgi:crotonobetainyl-CoA:carnitine CoA-transferase CaiB-like acyl-CoA transferase
MPIGNSGRALDGLHVVSLAAHLPGPLAVRQLMAFGAGVVKVEPPDGDPFAAYHRPWYEALADGQRVVRLDLKDPKARPALDDLLDNADLLLTSSRPSSLGRLGLGWPQVHERFPRLCYVAIVGSATPDSNRPGHDLTYQASAGLVAPPQLPAVLLADFAGAERSVGASLGLLLARERGADAGYAEVSLAAVAEQFNEPLRRGVTTPGSFFGGGLPGYGLYRARDGWVAVAALEATSWSAMRRAVGLAGNPVPSNSPADDPQLDRDALESHFLGNTMDHWESWAIQNDLPIVAIRQPPERIVR